MYHSYIDDESHDERRLRREEQKNNDICIKIDNDSYISIIKSLYSNYNVEDIHFVDGDKYNLRKNNILIKLTAILN